jgi:hypothetical protein
MVTTKKLEMASMPSDIGGCLPSPTPPPPPSRRKCSHPSCDNRVVQGGVCVTHGARRKGCTHPGCDKAVKLAGYCSTHGPPRSKCDEDGCVRLALQGGRCVTHGARRKGCAHPGCEKAAWLGGRCHAHRMGWAHQYESSPPTESSDNAPTAVDGVQTRTYDNDDGGRCDRVDDRRGADPPDDDDDDDFDHGDMTPSTTTTDDVRMRCRGRPRDVDEPPRRSRTTMRRRHRDDGTDRRSMITVDENSRFDDGTIARSRPTTNSYDDVEDRPKDHDDVVFVVVDASMSISRSPPRLPLSPPPPPHIPQSNYSGGMLNAGLRDRYKNAREEEERRERTGRMDGDGGDEDVANMANTTGQIPSVITLHPLQEERDNQLVAIMRRNGGCRRTERVIRVKVTWNLYYPLYSGWSFPPMPYFFLTPGEACSWALSRFKRDGLSNIWGKDVYPEFIQFVGVIATEASSFQECTKTVDLSSKIEEEFFRGWKFFRLLKTNNSTKSYERIDPTEFGKLSADLFRSRIDFQFSTISVYRKGFTASRSITKTSYEVNDQLQVMQETSPDHIIRLEVICRHMNDHTLDCVEATVCFLSRYNSLSEFNRIVVSVCAGMAETELHSNEMCICLDVDKRFLFSANFAQTLLCPKEYNRLICHRHDMSNGLYSLISQLRDRTALPLVILFQHPSPTMKPHKLSIASRDCFRALSDNVLESVHYVYDRHIDHSKTFWKYDSLIGTITSQCPSQIMESLQFTPEKSISEFGDDLVQHPVYGQVPRVGWAAWKKGIEVSFSVLRKV